MDNYHNFYGPFQISENKVYIKGMYRALDLNKFDDVQDLSHYAQMQLAELRALRDEWEYLLDTISEREEADYWNEMFRKDGLS